VKKENLNLLIGVINETWVTDYLAVGEVKLTARGIKHFNHYIRRGNNWRRLHGKSLFRVPLRERRKRK